MRRSLSGLAVAIAGAVLLTACADYHVAYVPQGQAISVHGRWLVRGHAIFVPRGVQIVGLVAPDHALTGPYAQAHRHFGMAELRAAVAYHVDTIRFQVSQYGLDPNDTLYSPAYLREVVGAVRMARRLGLAVIVSVQAEPPAGRAHRCPLPDAGTLRVWDKIAKIFRADRGVMFELYNEPAIPPDPLGWALWRAGGLLFYSVRSCVAVGMQELINSIRARGARNVIIVPAPSMQRTIAGLPRLTDPASPADPQLAYSIHYPSLIDGWPAWQHQFGAASARVPVIVTEWNADSSRSCVPVAPIAAPMLLNYLAGKYIGVVGFAFDMPGTIIRNWSYVPTSYNGFQCGIPGGGPGQLLFNRFAEQARYRPG